jgi:hypothetical protein
LGSRTFESGDTHELSGEHVQRDLPEPGGGFVVEGVNGDAVVAAGLMRLGFSDVLEVPSADALDEGRSGKQRRCRRSLLGRLSLIGVLAASVGESGVHCFVAGVALEVSADAAGHQRVGDDAVVGQRRAASTAKSTLAVLDGP